MKAIRKQNRKIFISAKDITDNSLDDTLTHGYQISMKLYLTFLLRNLYAGQEATVRIGHGTTQTDSKWEKEFVKADRKSVV